MFRRDQFILLEFGDVEYISIVIFVVFWSLICVIFLLGYVYVYVYFYMYMNVNIIFIQDLKIGVYVYIVFWFVVIYYFLVLIFINDDFVLYVFKKQNLVKSLYFICEKVLYFDYD